MNSKRMKKISEMVDNTAVYKMKEAVDKLFDCPRLKFNESVDVAIGLNIDIRKADQNIRGVINLPHGSGKNVKVAVFAKDEKAKEAKEAGADIVGEDDLIEEIKGGKINFDRCIATPDMMPKIGKISRILGPKGLMPNPKLGSVTTDIATAVKNTKGGQVEYRAEKAGIVHACVGKLSFSKEQVLENITAFIDNIKKIRPSATKGIYIRNISISSTMGPGIDCELSS